MTPSPTRRRIALVVLITSAVLLSALLGTTFRFTEWFVFAYTHQGVTRIHWFPAFLAIGTGGLAWALAFQREIPMVAAWAGYTVLARYAFGLAASFGAIPLAVLTVLAAPLLIGYAWTRSGRGGGGRAR